MTKDSMLTSQAGIERKYLTWADSAGQALTSSRPTDSLPAGQGQGGRQTDGQAVAANPGPELVLAWVDNTFHNLRQRKVISECISSFVVVLLHFHFVVTFAL